MTLQERKALGPWTQAELRWYYMEGPCRDCDHRVGVSTEYGTFECYDSCIGGIADPITDEYYWQLMVEGFYDPDRPMEEQVRELLEAEHAAQPGGGH